MSFTASGGGNRRWRRWLAQFAGAPLLVLLVACSMQRGAPKGPESAMLVGRVLINNKFGGTNRLLPLGLQGAHIQVEIRSDDGARLARIITEKDGYFFFPNLAPGVYYIRSVVLEAVNQKRSDAIRFSVHALKADVQPQTVVYLGTVWAEVSNQGAITLKELHEPEKARARVLQAYPNLGWEGRQFVFAPPVPLRSPAQKLPR